MRNNTFTSILIRMVKWLAKVVGISLAVIVLLAFLVQIFGATIRYRPCVVLPNGLIIGREAMIAPRKYFMQPDVVLKSEDGRTLVDFNIEGFYFSETSVFGAVRENGEWQEIAYHPDLGLVFEKDDPETYRRIIDEAGPIIDANPRFKNTNLLGAYYGLLDVPPYGRRWCGLALFRF